MAICNQSNDPLTPLTRELYDTLTKSFYDKIEWPAHGECLPPKTVECEVEVIDETSIKIDGVLYLATINAEWVDFKEVVFPGEYYLGRKATMSATSWQQMMDLYKQGQTTFNIETYG